ncbi:hypothetical protein FRB90_002796, partial [Tulasnella sp. 427]
WIQPGRFSDILYGYCHSLAETVALKRLRLMDDGEASPRDLRLFNEEATIWHTLDHPHVLPLRGIYVCPQGFTYLVSPYMDNGDLMSYLKQNPLADRRSLLCDIASAIAYLHSLSIIHGDIKARNILVSQDGGIRLCDFGLSKYSSWTTSEGRKGAGTIRWQAPELLFDEHKSFKSDVYAFGITVYEVLSGNLPFGSSSDGAIVYNVVLRNTRPPCLPKFGLKGESYAGVWALARECWARVPECRPEMGTVWKRLEMEVFPEATLRVMAVEKERVGRESERVEKRAKGVGGATGGVGPPPTPSARRGRTFTVDAATDNDDQESDNELSTRRHTIDVQSIPRPGSPVHRFLVDPVTQVLEPNAHLECNGNEDEEEDEEEEFLFTPNDSPLLGATVGPVYRTARGGLLPSDATGGADLLEAIEEEFSLEGGNDDDAVEETQAIDHGNSITRRPGLPAGGNKHPNGGDNRPWLSIGGGSDSKNTKSGPILQGGKQERSHRDRRSDSHAKDHSSSGDDSSSSSTGGGNTPGYLISSLFAMYGWTKSFLNGKTIALDQQRDAKSETTTSSVDWAHWDGAENPVMKT